MASDVILSQIDGFVGIARLNRPDVLNALNIPLMDELITLFEKWDNDPAVRCIVLTGNDKAFAAGADIKEMAEASVVDITSGTISRGGSGSSASASRSSRRSAGFAWAAGANWRCTATSSSPAKRPSLASRRSILA
jgi:enoyl-CoA hydratase/carnithine racemase